tara:strand:+ start:291 stop:425 length:135 start_codon:yes stop_codon:yes gene_type:complete
LIVKKENIKEKIIDNKIKILNSVFLEAISFKLKKLAPAIAGMDK